MDHMSNLLAETLVAHELAHVVIWLEIKSKSLPAADQAAYNALDGESEPLFNWLEKTVNQRIRTWNDQYNGQALIDWLNYYLKHRVSPPVPQRDVPLEVPVPEVVHPIIPVPEPNLDPPPLPQQEAPPEAPAPAVAIPLPEPEQSQRKLPTQTIALIVLAIVVLILIGIYLMFT